MHRFSVKKKILSLATSIDLKPISDAELSCVLIPIKEEGFHLDARGSGPHSTHCVVSSGFRLVSVGLCLSMCRTWALLCC